MTDREAYEKAKGVKNSVGLSAFPAVDPKHADNLQKHIALRKEQEAKKTIGKPPTKKEKSKQSKYTLAFLYLYQHSLKTPDGATLVKMGWSHHPESRPDSQKTFNPGKLRLLAKIPRYRFEEQLIQNHFERYRWRGTDGEEWFRLEGEYAEFVKVVTGEVE